MHPPAESPAPPEPEPGPYESRYRRRPLRDGRNNSLGIFVLALVIGSMMGATCVTCATLSEQETETYFATGDRVGVVEVVGDIVDSKETIQEIRRFIKREDVVAIVVRIDSPGGAVAPSQSIYEAIRHASKSKPVVASMGSMAASGGFWISLGADWVFAEPGTITGSIGVIFQTPDLRGVAEALRFRLLTYKSGPLKDMGNPFREATPEDEAQFKALIDDIYDQFVSVTAQRRGQPRAKILAVADGRIMTGRAALKADLIDELGGLHVAAKKAVLLAKARGDRPVQTSSAAYDDIEEPVLIYPPGSSSNFAELFGARIGAAVRDGVAEGVRSGLRAPASNVELR